MNNSKAIPFILLHAAIIFFFAILFYVPKEVDLNFQRLCLILYFLSTICYFIVLRDEKNNHLSFNKIFLIGYFIVFFQVSVLQQFGYYMPAWSYNKFWSSSDMENVYLVVSSMAIILYMLGNVYSQLFTNTDREIKARSETESTFFLLIIAYAAYVSFFSTSGSYRTGAYYAGDALGVSSYFFKIFNVALIGAIIIKVTTICNKFSTMTLVEYIKFFGAPLLLLLTWHLLFSLYVGDRGVIVSYGLLCGSIYLYRFKKISVVKLVIILLTASTFLTVIGEVRKEKDYAKLLELTSNSSEATNSKWYNEQVPGGSFVELALSGRTLNHSLDNVPSNYDYRYGIYTLKRIAGIIPGAQGIVDNLIDNNESKYVATSAFISYLVQGNHPQYGDGTSITADIYLDFGIMGVFIIMFLFGLFMGNKERYAYKGYLSYLELSWVAFLIYYSKSLYLSRSSIMLEFSTIVLVWLFLLLNNILVSNYKK